MRTAIISDIHGNLTALEAVLRDLRTTAPDQVLHGGDLVAHGARPSQVADLIQSLGWPGVVGNTDEMLWKPEEAERIFGAFPKRAALRKVIFEEMAPFTVEHLSPAQVDRLRSLPMQIRTDGFTLVHASPDDSWVAPLADATDEEFERAYGGLRSSLVVYAHIHRAFVRQCPGFVVANTGAVSLPYDGDWRASYLLIDDDIVSHRRVEYDRDAEEVAIRASGTPRVDWLVHLMKTGEFCLPF
jgi:predicted phosphodiesterase